MSGSYSERVAISFSLKNLKNTSSIAENGLMMVGFQMVDVYLSCALTIDRMVLVLVTIVITVCLCYVAEKLLSC
jgi:hypothetical protein